MHDGNVLLAMIFVQNGGLFEGIVNILRRIFHTITSFYHTNLLNFENYSL